MLTPDDLATVESALAYIQTDCKGDASFLDIMDLRSEVIAECKKRLGQPAIAEAASEPAKVVIKKRRKRNALTPLLRQELQRFGINKGLHLASMPEKQIRFTILCDAGLRNKRRDEFGASSERKIANRANRLRSMLTGWNLPEGICPACHREVLHLRDWSIFPSNRLPVCRSCSKRGINGEHPKQIRAQYLALPTPLTATQRTQKATRDRLIRLLGDPPCCPHCAKRVPLPDGILRIGRGWVFQKNFLPACLTCWRRGVRIGTMQPGWGTVADLERLPPPTPPAVKVRKPPKYKGRLPQPRTRPPRIQ